MNVRQVRADEIKVGDHLLIDNDELMVLKVRDASDGQLVLTLRRNLGRATELRVQPWHRLEVIES